MKKRKETLTVIVDSRIAVYSIEPLIKELLRQNERLQMVTYPNIEAQFLIRFPELAGKFTNLNELDDRLSFQKRLHSFLRLLLTPKNYSNKYSSTIRASLESKNTFGRFLIKFIQALPKSKGNRINQRIRALLCPITPNILPSSRVLVTTVFQTPHLLCSRNLKIYSLAESWDHAFKWPVGYCSDTVFVWNKSLAADWTAYQGDTNVETLFPFKLRYLLSAQKPSQSVQTKTLLYPFSTTSVSNLGKAFEEELIVAKVICKAAAKTGWNVRLKPKPNGRLGELQCICDQFKNTSVASYGEASKSTDYYLDDAYNDNRIRDLAKADLVINLYTTYALDASLAGRPVLQLDLSQNQDLPAVKHLFRNQHLQKYFLSRRELSLFATTLNELESKLVAWLRTPDNKAIEYQTKLRNWVLPSYDSKSCLKKATQIITRNDR
jgi:hypothetical protein